MGPRRKLGIATGVAIAAITAMTGSQPASALTFVSQSRTIDAAITGQVDAAAAPDFGPFSDDVNLFVSDPVTCMCAMQGGGTQFSTLDENAIVASGEARTFVLSSGAALEASGGSYFETVFDLSEPRDFALAGHLSPLVCELIDPPCNPGAVWAVIERLVPTPEVLFASTSGGSLAASGTLTPGTYRVIASTSASISGVPWAETRSAYSLSITLSPLTPLPSARPGWLIVGLALAGVAAARALRLDTLA